MKKIFITVSKLSIIAACVCIAVMVGLMFANNTENEIPAPRFLGIAMVVVTFLGMGCLLIASALEIYQRVKADKSRAVKSLLVQLAVICGVCFLVARTLESLISAACVVVGSWGMNYIYRKDNGVL